MTILKQGIWCGKWKFEVLLLLKKFLPSPSILLRGLREPEREKVSAMLPWPPTSVSRASSATSILSRLAPEDTSARETEEPSPTSARLLERGRWRRCWATAQNKPSWGTRQSATPGTAQTGAEGILCTHTSDSSSVTSIISNSQHTIRLKPCSDGNASTDLGDHVTMSLAGPIRLTMSSSHPGSCYHLVILSYFHLVIFSSCCDVIIMSSCHLNVLSSCILSVW